MQTQWIYDCIPGLEDLMEVDQLAAVRHARNWVSANIPMSVGTCQWDQSSRDIDLRSIVYLAQNDLIGFCCRGLAITLSRVYEMMGLETMVYGTAIWDYVLPELPNLSHSFSIVKVDVDGKNFLIAQDSLFNAEYGLRDETFSDFRKLLESLPDRHNDVVIVNGDPDARVELVIDSERFYKQPSSFLKTPSEWFHYPTHKITIDYMAQSPKLEGQEPSFALMLLFPHVHDLINVGADFKGLSAK